MRKLFGSLGLILLAASPAWGQTNLVRNGGFETDPVSPWPWFLMECPAHLSSDAHSGVRSMALQPIFDTHTCANMSAGVASEIIQDIPLPTPNTYTFDFWAKQIDPALASQTQLALNGFSQFALTDDWQYFTYTWTTPASYYFTSYSLTVHGNNVVVDDISMTAATTPEPSSVALLTMALIPFGLFVQRKYTAINARS